MNVETERLETQLKRILEGEAWHGASILEVLQDVTAESAYAHPVSGAHSIWEIVLHLAATYRLVLQRIQGHSGSLNAEQDWPAVAAPEAERWHEAVKELRRLNREVRLTILAFAGDRLDQMLVAGHASA